MIGSTVSAESTHHRAVWVAAMSSAFGEIEEIGAIVALTNTSSPDWLENRHNSQKNNDLALFYKRQARIANNSTGEVSDDQ
ncbi:MAG: hypothetical protein AAF353_15435 [Pseudomonadota bacterium]